MNKKTQRHIWRLLVWLLIATLMCPLLVAAATEVPTTEVIGATELPETTEPVELEIVEDSNSTILPEDDGTVSVTGTGGGDDFSSAVQIYFHNTPTIRTTESGEKRYFKFVPSETGNYLIYSIATSGDPKLWLYSGSHSLICENDDGAGSKNFRVLTSLTAGSTYFFEAGHYGSNTGSYILFILRETQIENGIYYLQNDNTGYFMDIHGPTAQEYVHQWEYYVGTPIKWQFIANSDGYYSIRSTYGSKKYVAISSIGTETDNIILRSEDSQPQRWKIYKNYLGVCYLEPRTAPGKVLTAADSSMGSELQLAHLGSNVSNRNRWSVVTRVLSLVNYYDSTLYGNTNLIRNFTKANEFSDFVFSKYYTVSTDMDGTATLYSGIIDQCPTNSYVSCSTSACGSNCFNHHKNMGNVIDSLYKTTREADHIYTLWTNRPDNTYCNSLLGQHATVQGTLAQAIRGKAAIHFMNIQGTSTNQQLGCMAYSFLHEMMHVMGLEEMYNNIGHDLDSGTLCVMEKYDIENAYEFYYDVIYRDKMALCASCDAILRDCIPNLNYPEI